MRLREGRVLEITDMLLSLRGGEFPCHKTVNYEGLDAEDDAPDGKLHCAGALIFAEKNETQTQMMRISHRLGLYEPEKLMADQAVVDSVFDTVEEMTEHLTSPQHAKSKTESQTPGAEGTPQAIPGRSTFPEPVRRVPQAKREQRKGTHRTMARERRKINAHTNERS